MIKKLISVIGATTLTLVAYPLFTDATGAETSEGATQTFEKIIRRNTVGTGAVTLIQRFGPTLNLNIHFHL